VTTKKKSNGKGWRHKGRTIGKQGAAAGQGVTTGKKAILSF